MACERSVIEKMNGDDQSQSNCLLSWDVGDPGPSGKRPGPLLESLPHPPHRDGNPAHHQPRSQNFYIALDKGGFSMLCLGTIKHFLPSAINFVERFCTVKYNIVELKQAYANDTIML